MFVHAALFIGKTTRILFFVVIKCLTFVQLWLFWFLWTTGQVWGDFGRLRKIRLTRFLFPFPTGYLLNENREVEVHGWRQTICNLREKNNPNLVDGINVQIKHIYAKVKTFCYKIKSYADFETRQSLSVSPCPPTISLSNQISACPWIQRLYHFFKVNF